MRALTWLLRMKTLRFRNTKLESSPRKVSIDVQYSNGKPVNSSISIGSKELLSETTQLKKQLEEEKELLLAKVC